MGSEQPPPGKPPLSLAQATLTNAIFFGCNPPGKEDFKQSSGAIRGLVRETMLVQVFHLLP